MTPSGQQIECGIVVACYLPQYKDEEPQIGRVVTIEDDNIEVEWMSGSYTQALLQCARSVVKYGKSRFPKTVYFFPLYN